MQPTSSQPHLQPFIESTLEQQLREQIQREREESLPLHFQVRQLLDENFRLQQSFDKLHDDVVDHKSGFIIKWLLTQTISLKIFRFNR